MPNPTGNYSRIKTWGAADTVLGPDLNAEFDNVLSNFNPEMLAAYSQNQAQMQIQTTPGTVGNESLATALSGELERLRYQIAAITGNTYWYSAPSTSLSQINSLIGAVAFGNKITSGLTTGTTGSTQPIFLLAANTTNSVTLKATATAFAYQISGTSYSIAADTTLTGLTVAPSSQNTATVNDLTLGGAGTLSTQLLGENGSQITMTSAGTNITTQVGNIAAFKTTASEYLIGRVESATQLTHVSRGYFFNSSNALVSRGTLSHGDTLTLMKLAWIYATSAGAIAVSYTNPKAGGLAPSSPATGDYWYDTSVSYWKTYNSTAWVQANVLLIGLAITDTANTVATRSFDYFAAFSDLNTCELFADSQNSGTIVRSKNTNVQVSVNGNIIVSSGDYARWDFSLHMDTGSQTASTLYYFYIDTNGRPWISKVPPFDRAADLKGYYHPSQPWRCVGYGYSNSATLVDNVESFYRKDDTAPVSNITAASVPIVPMNIVQREQVITLTGAAGAFTQVLPHPSQLKGKFLTYVRTDNTLGNVVTLQSWGTQLANPTGTISITTTPTKITGLSSTASLVVGQLISGPGIAPNTTLVNLEGGTAATMSTSAILTLTSGTFNFANAAGYSGTVGQQTGYLNYGLNGQFTTTLNTQYESITITSDGYVYFIVNRGIPSTWILSGPVGNSATLIAATTTAGTKGTNTTDQMYWRRVGPNAEIRFSYVQTAAGTAGTGDYIFTLPTGLTADTTRVAAFATISAGGTVQPSNSLGYCQLYGSTGPTICSGSVILYDSTHVRLLNGQNAIMTGASNNPSLSSVNITYNATFSVPILGWNG